MTTNRAIAWIIAAVVVFVGGSFLLWLYLVERVRDGDIPFVG